MDQDRVNAAAKIANVIEPSAFASWPAREILDLGGWRLRFTDGYSHRGSSVAALGAPDCPLDRAIDFVEREYAARNLVPQFQVTPAALPSDLEQALIARRYTVTAPTMVMIADPKPGDGETGRVDLLQTPSAAFDRLVVSGSRSEGDGNERLEILSRIADAHVRVLAFDGDVPVSCGLAVHVNDHVGIYLMRTDAAHRRRGHARRVLTAIARWAKARNATQLYLQVEDANAPARALYTRAGFTDAYPYRYYVRT